MPLLSEYNFAHFGADEIKYTRQFMQGNKKHFLRVAGDGRLLGVAPDHETDIADTIEKNFERVSMH